MASKKDVSEIRHALEDNRAALAEVLSITKGNAEKLTSVKASLEFAFEKIDNLEKAIPAVENKIKAVENHYKQQILLMEARSMQYNLVFLNPPSFSPEVDHDTKARRLMQLCGITAEKANSIALRRSHPLPKHRKPGSTQSSNPNFLVAFLGWDEKEYVLKSARLKPDEMKDMRVVSHWPQKIKAAHGQLKASSMFKSAKQLNKDPQIKINFRQGLVSLIIAGKTEKVVEAWSLPDYY